jgi:glycosyltransferase involved in cell wall biosynthesis
VDDVRHYIAKAKVFVAPLRIGGGTRLKILEAMAMGKAVVSTSIGAEGIACADGKDIFLRDTPDLFAETVLSLLLDTQKGREIGENARSLAVNTYDWKIIGQRLNNIYSSLNNENSK